MATCVGVGGGQYPLNYQGQDRSSMEGTNLFEILEGQGKPERVLAFEHQGTPAIRVGDWKLVSRNRQSMLENDFSETAEFELYHVTEDRSETQDLAGKYPDKVRDLKKAMLEEFRRTKIFPRPVRKKS